MRLYDTAQREIVQFQAGEVVKIYTCGITPYDATHIGHAAMVIAYDVLQRRLQDIGHEVRLVRNITDVDDSILQRAREIGVDWKQLGDGETKRFKDDIAALGVLSAHSEPLASEAIDEMLTLIETLLVKGHAYESGGQIYFDINSWKRFGELSQFDRTEMLGLAAERGGNPGDPNKKDPLDFILWQKSLDDEPSWSSPWGAGRPGWHIECSCLAMRELGTTIDLHGGGADLVFPHHECEIAQSEAISGEPFARHWMHVAMVGMNGQKMSKSLGNLVFISDLLSQWQPAVIRLAIVARHYRTEWEWHDEIIEAANSRFRLWKRAGKGDAGLEAVRAALDEDLDTPAAVELIDEAAARGHGVSEAAALLGVSI